MFQPFWGDYYAIRSTIPKYRHVGKRREGFSPASPGSRRPPLPPGGYNTSAAAVPRRCHRRCGPQCRCTERGRSEGPSHLSCGLPRGREKRLRCQVYSGCVLSLSWQMVGFMGNCMEEKSLDKAELTVVMDLVSRVEQCSDDKTCTRHTS
jgi:hypothetical protein